MLPDNQTPPKKQEKRNEARQLLEASALAWMFPIAIALGALWGWGMDRWFGTWPWLTGIFTGFGVIAAFVNLFRIGMRE
ncbi:MAG TPA: AtpZ/AtpI family protein [Thermoanaerobaculia bacterium]|nr:AtpZ/AtpI family protein [Thermoanaerobaculia bacterium]